MTITSIQDMNLLQNQLGTSHANISDTNDFNEALQKAIEEQDTEEIKDGCKQLESYMLAEIFKQMKKSMCTGDTLLGKGDYEEMFEDTMIETMCESMVESGGIGLADFMYRQITSTYGAQNNMSKETTSQLVSHIDEAK